MKKNLLVWWGTLLASCTLLLGSTYAAGGRRAANVSGSANWSGQMFSGWSMDQSGTHADLMARFSGWMENHSGYNGNRSGGSFSGWAAAHTGWMADFSGHQGMFSGMNMSGRNGMMKGMKDHMAKGSSGSMVSARLQTAIQWMNANGLTKFSDPSSFWVGNSLTREQASKFFAQFAQGVLNLNASGSTTCSFNDESKIDPSLQADVTTACQLGLFKGSKGYFNPKSTLSTADMMTVLQRLVKNNLPSGLLDSSVQVSSNVPTTRGIIAEVLYKLSQLEQQVQALTQTGTQAP